MSGKRLSKRQLREQQQLHELAQLPAPTSSSSANKTPFQQLAEPSDDEDSAQEEDRQAATVVSSKSPTASSIFAALGDENHDSHENQDEEDQHISTQQATKSKKNNSNNKKKSAPVATTAADAEKDAQPTSAPSKSSNKKSSSSKKSSAAPPAQSKDVSEMSIDEFDALLASQATLSTTHASSGTRAASSSAPSAFYRVSAFRSHLSLDPCNLDPAIELRRQFGSAAIKAYQSEAASSSGSHASGARARAQANNPNLKLRSLLCTPKHYWPPINRSFTGMSMDLHDLPSIGKICEWKHSKAYRQVQVQFLQAVRSYDPNSLMALLRIYPYHIDTLLQLSEYSRHQGDLGQAADFNDRALFALERCAAPYFTSCLSSTSSGPPVVNFNKIENRAFYLALHRNIGFLGRRGTWRTALEWSKLLLGLGQDGEDHHAALLWIDFLAIKSRQHRWLLDLIQRLDEQRSRASGQGVSHVDGLSAPAKTPIDSTDKQLAAEGSNYAGTLDWCVGLAYSRALALRAVEKEEGDKSHSRSNAALRLAIARFPAVVPLLCNKAGVDLPSNIAGHPFFQLESRFLGSKDTLSDLLTHIYVLRSESLWKEQGYAQWLRNTTMDLVPTLTADFDLPGKQRKTQPAVASHNTRQGIYRHVLVSDVPDTVRQQLIAYLPPSITGSSEEMDSFDPVPPRSKPSSVEEGLEAKVQKVTRYDDEYFAPILAHNTSSGGRGLRGSAGAAGGEGGVMAAFRRALQGFGGLQGWDAAMENMDDETREDVMAQIMAMTQQAEGRMPGAFGDEGVEGREGEDGERGAGRGGMGAFEALRGALDAIWGGGGQAQAQAHVHEEDDEEEQQRH